MVIVEITTMLVTMASLYVSSVINKVGMRTSLLDTTGPQRNK